MPIEANYETYYGIKLTHYTYAWGGTNYGGTYDNGILVKDFPNENLVSTDYTETTEMRFIYPRPITPKAFLDGTAEGHISIYNASTTTIYSVTSFTVSIMKSEDVPGDEEILGSYFCSLTTDNSVPTEDYLTLPFFIDIEEKELNANEKIIFYITFACSGTVDIGIGHANDSDIIDMQIKMPFAPEGY